MWQIPFCKWHYENKEGWMEAERAILNDCFITIANSYPWLLKFLNISNKSATPDLLNAFGRKWLWLVQNHLSRQLKGENWFNFIKNQQEYHL